MEILYLNIFCGIISFIIFMYIIFFGCSSENCTFDDIDNPETPHKTDIGFVQFLSLQSFACALFGFALFGLVYYSIFSMPSLFISIIGAFSVYIILKFQYKLIKKLQILGETSSYKEIPLEGNIVKILINVYKDQKGLVSWKTFNNEIVEYIALLDSNSINTELLEGDVAVVRKNCGTYLIIS